MKKLGLAFAILLLLSSTAHAVDWPNEPTGATVITDDAFSDAIPCCGNSLVVGSGWAVNNFGLITEVTDSSAPLSPPNTLQMEYPIGFSSAGIGPGNMYYEAPGPNGSLFYFAYWFKISDPWQGHDSGFNKLTHTFDSVSTSRALIFDSPAGSQTGSVGNLLWYTPSTTISNCHLTGIVSSDCSIGGHSIIVCGLCNVSITLGQWHRVEMILKNSTSPTSQDGIVKAWLDGTLVMNYTNYNTDQFDIVEFQIAPTWGGVGGTNKTEDDFLWFDHIHVSFGGTVDGGGDTTLPDTSIVTHPTDPTTNVDASFTFTSTEGSTFECKPVAP
jgi:hypothetical protein